MEINDWYTVPLDVILTIQTTQKKKSFPFYLQIKHRSTVHDTLKL